ncbi:MAG: VWA domain-containing protein [Candidatus Poribacteria bacterium]|nr:VWA domain-containing protein [Candidatus Poribacteria bacterium]
MMNIVRRSAMVLVAMMVAWGCSEDALDTNPDTPDLAGVAITQIEESDDSGAVTLSLSITDTVVNAEVDPSAMRVRVWESIVGTDDEELVYDSKPSETAEVAAAPLKKDTAVSTTEVSKSSSDSVDIAIVLDRSGSINPSEEHEMEQAAIAVVNSLRNSDHVEIINVATTVVVDASLRGSNSSEITRAITNPSVSAGWSRIFDGALQGVAHLGDTTQRKNHANIVLVMTDGEDNRSSASMESLISGAVRLSVPIFIVAIADSSDPTDLHSTELSTVANSTGGRFVQTASELNLTSIASSLTQSAVSRYEVTYETPYEESDGERAITVEVTVNDKTTTTKSKVAKR